MLFSILTLCFLFLRKCTEIFLVEEGKKPCEETVRFELPSVINLYLNIELKTELSKKLGIYNSVTLGFDSNIERGFKDTQNCRTRKSCKHVYNDCLKRSFTFRFPKNTRELQNARFLIGDSQILPETLL